MFCVISACSLPRRSSSASARCPGFGFAFQAVCSRRALPGRLAHFGIGHVVVDVGELLGLRVLRPDALRAAEIRDAGVGGDARAGQHHDTLRLFDPAPHLLHRASLNCEPTRTSATSTVNRLGFGAMRVCGPNVWGPPKDRANAHRVLRRAFELGREFLRHRGQLRPARGRGTDRRSAPSLPEGPGHRHQGRPAAPAPRRLGPRRPARAPEAGDRRQPEAPEARAHRPLPAARARSEGAVRRFGRRAGRRRSAPARSATSACRTSASKQLEEARRICTIVSVQNEYNLENRSSEDVLKACEKLGIAFLPWYPLGAGAVLKIRNDYENFQEKQSNTRPGRARLAAGEVAGDAADSRHRDRSRTWRRTLPRRS